MKLFLKTYSEQDTIDEGVKFSKNLIRGSVVALFGDLGTGKTRFIKGICAGMGISEHVASPTFTIVNEYHGTEHLVFHFDFYRIKSVTETQEIGFDEYIYREGISLIEWADKVRDLLPPNRFEVHLSFGEKENIREIFIEEIIGVTA